MADRPSKWDTRPPRDWRWAVGTVGKVLIAVGLLLFSFVAYQLWGTAIETARAQNRLESEFEDLLAAAGTDTSPATTTTAPATTTTVAPTTVPPTAPPTSAPGETVPPGTAPAETVPPETVPPETTTTTIAPVVQELPPIGPGEPIARLEMPTIGTDHIVVAGVTVDDLKKGPGHFPSTPLPGQLGNAAIAGHRTTFGEPFRRIDRLEPGDEIIVSTLAGRFVYRVFGTQIVEPSQSEVIATSDPNAATLTLVSCHPAFSTRQRIIVVAGLDPSASAPIGVATPYGDGQEALPDEEVPEEVPATTEAPTDGTAPVTSDPEATPESVPVVTTPVDGGGGTDASTGQVTDATADAFARGWFSDPDAWGQIALWGALLTLIAVGAYLLSRRTRHDLVGLAVGIVPFVVVLYFFFQNVNRLLPPGF
ncbi:MAG: sortase [Ilumatobacteraceae bacterium]|nr:sortase [Ilumatobacteraceae bacterium]